MNFRVFQRRNWRGKLLWYFHARADGNNKKLFQSEGYHNLGDAMQTIRRIQRDARSATVHIEGEET